jgi:hypothetical protein
MHNQQLNEGLRSLDLKDLVKDTFEIDTYRSKMGEDKDVCVLSFHVLNREPARDLMEFIEKGFNFVLDADVSSGENKKGEYTVFVELNRSPKLPLEILEIMYGVKKLTGLLEWKFRFYKENGEKELNEDSIRSTVPLTPMAYTQALAENVRNQVKGFFNKTLMDDLTIEDSIITIYKPFDQKIQLKWLREDDPQAVLENSPSMDDNSTAEIFWFTKVLGDYNISKFGDKFLFSNRDKQMLLQRIDQ